jgi:ATP-dependent DNA helicase 2 subunit 2
MPFADDVRKYTFPSLVNLVSKKGEVVTKHPYIPTDEQLAAMDKFVDALDLMEAGEMGEDGCVISFIPSFPTILTCLVRHRAPWFDPTMSYNPAVHRTKQAMFHCAVVSDLNTNPLPPPHPELLQFLKPPKRLRKQAKAAIEECVKVFNVKEGTQPFPIPQNVLHSTLNLKCPRRSRNNVKTDTSARWKTVMTERRFSSKP